MSDSPRVTWSVQHSIGLAAILAVAVSLLAGPGATAGTPGATVSLGKSKGVEYMRAKYLNVVTQTSQPVQCDGDAEVSGGGGSISGSSDDAILSESYPTPESAWQVEGSSSAGPSRTLTGYALCVGADLEYYFTTENVTTGSSISNGAPCGAFGELVTGGGLQADLPGLLMNWTRPEPGVGARWYSYAQNEGGLTMVVDYWTVCTSSYVLRYRTAEANARRGRAATITAKCKPKEAVMGGGFHGSGNTGVIDAWPVATKPWDSKDDAKKVPDDGWRVTLHNGSNERKSITAHAVCLRGEAT
jgi:hypothetical protein